MTWSELSRAGMADEVRETRDCLAQLTSALEHNIVLIERLTKSERTDRVRYG